MKIPSATTKNTLIDAFTELGMDVEYETEIESWEIEEPVENNECEMDFDNGTYWVDVEKEYFEMDE